MAVDRDWVSILRGIVRQMVAADVTELEVRQGGLRVRLRRDPRLAAGSPQPPAGEAGGEGAEMHRVVAPLTGIFYASANPSSPPYVAVGEWVEPEAVVGLIETMKVFNEVTADCRGRVAALLAQQGQLVHTGEPLLLVDPTAAPDHAGEVAP